MPASLMFRGMRALYADMSAEARLRGHAYEDELMSLGQPQAAATHTVGRRRRRRSNPCRRPLLRRLGTQVRPPQKVG